MSALHRRAPVNDLRRRRGAPGAWRLLAPAIVGWGCAAWAVAHPGTGVWLIVLGASCVAAMALGRRIERRRTGATMRSGLVAGMALLGCAVLVLLGARIGSAERLRADPLLTVTAENGGVLRFEARLTGFPERAESGFGTRAWVRGEALRPGGAVPVLLWLNDESAGTAAAGDAVLPRERWGPGTRIEVRGVPERLAPGDSAAFAVSVRALVAAIDQPWPSRAGAIAAGLRADLRETAAGIAGAELVPGFAVGDTSLVGEELEQAMLAASLSHLIAVSGANCALVTGAVIGVLARFGTGRRVRLLVAASALLGFVLLVGPDPSVQRAAVMAAALLAAGFGGRRSTALPALGLAILVLLIADPWQALHPGFALSVAATAGILLLAEPLGRWLRRRARLPAPLALPVAVALAAQSACGPLLLLLQPGIPAIGVLANVLVAPAAPLGTGLGLLAALLGPLHPALAHGLVLLASLPARWVVAIAELSAAAPLGRWHWPEGWSGAILLLACQGGMLLAWALHRGHLGLPGSFPPWRAGGAEGRRARPGGGIRVEPRRPWQAAERAPRAIRAAVWSLLGVSLGLALGVTLLGPLLVRLGVPDDWVVVACDVGQGDAILLRDPARPAEPMLIDTGDDPERIDACLERFGVERIALLVLTHDDADHVGALGAVIDRAEAALIAPTVLGERTAEREVVRRLDAAAVPYVIAAAGMRRPAGGAGPAWAVLAPEATGRAPRDTNAASLVLLAEAGAARVLLLADTGREEQARLLRAGARIDAQVLKVAHHGSRDQDPALPAAVGAEWALVSVGAGNGYGHPTAETLGALARAGTRALRTDEHGSIALVADSDGRLAARVERGGG